jgi:hypothetical protein
MMDRDAMNVHQMVMASNIVDGQYKSTNTNEMVSLAPSGSPEALLGGGYHFEDCPLNRKIIQHEELTPMDLMYNTVHYKELVRPTKRK